MTGLATNIAVIERFVAACRSDDRVLAAFLSGSHASGTADAYSDLDLCLIARDDDRDELWADRSTFIRQLGEPLLLEDFDLPATAFFILADGTEAELSIVRADQIHEVHRGPYRALLDKAGILDGGAVGGTDASGVDQTEILRRQIQWFWHDLSHLIAAVGRGQLWWALGQIETLRRICVTLVRLDENFGAEPEGYDKLDQAVPASRLSALQSTFVPMERGAILEAAATLVEFYRQLAPAMSEAHGLAYPTDLDRLVSQRLARTAIAATGPR